MGVATCDFGVIVGSLLLWLCLVVDKFDFGAKKSSAHNADEKGRKNEHEKS
ncbi:MAG: hypothetical protein HDT48_04545 [Ruminococcaceae bacterium]|nr:hypothetical protein [Oscillospiraceae bacterium]